MWRSAIVSATVVRKASCLCALWTVAILAQAGRAGIAGGLAREQRVFPGAMWSRIEDPRTARSDVARLQDLRDMLRGGQTTGMLVVVGGRVLFDFGNTSEVSYIASARKSIVSMLYGKYVTNGTIPL